VITYQIKTKMTLAKYQGLKKARTGKKCKFAVTLSGAATGALNDFMVTNGLNPSEAMEVLLAELMTEVEVDPKTSLVEESEEAWPNQPESLDVQSDQEEEF